MRYPSHVGLFASMELIVSRPIGRQMSPLRYVVLTVVVVAVIGASAYLAAFAGPSGTGTTTTTMSPNPGGSTTSQLGAAASFTYSPSSPVRIDSVTDSLYSGSKGEVVTFRVNYTNVGSGDIYYVNGCGSSLVADVPSSSAVLQKVSGGPVCLCDEVLTPLAPGKGASATTPGCWSGYSFVLVGHGAVQVELTISWGQAQSGSGSTTIDATFAFD